MTKSGFYFIEAMPKPGERNPEPGLAEPEKWEPYKVWVGDRWVCPGCGAVILTGFGREPLSEHFMSDFKEWVDRTNASQLQVNDC